MGGWGGHWNSYCPLPYWTANKPKGTPSNCHTFVLNTDVISNVFAFPCHHRVPSNRRAIENRVTPFVA